jgi:tetratricopeptide (TPR) repeat protein
MKQHIAICLGVLLLLPSLGLSCSMYKLTKDGKTIVGNNEDWTSPNGQFWFEAGTEDSFGVMYVGFLNNFAQGAINEAGLMFDGFWEPFLAVEDTAGKLDIPIQEALTFVMQTMTEVEEVQAYLQRVKLGVLENGQLVFVDRSGTYLVIEGDHMFVGDEAEKAFSNFYYSQIDSITEVSLPYFQKGQQFIDTTALVPSLGYCSKAMEQFSQSSIASTQYSTIYDLQSLTIRVYLFHDYSNFVEIDLKKELQKGNHRSMIAELFPKTSVGYKHYAKYNNPEHPTLLLEELIGDNELTEEEFLSNGFDGIIQGLGFEWLDDIKNPQGAIKVFTYGTQLMPNQAKLHANLGEAYFANKAWKQALESYEKALELDPEHAKAKEMITEIGRLLEKE